MLSHDWRKGPFAAENWWKRQKARDFNSHFLGWMWYSRDWVQGLSTSSPTTCRSKSSPTSPFLQERSSEGIKCHAEGKKLQKALKKMKKAVKKFWISFDVGLDKVKHLKKKRSEQLWCYAKAGTGTTSWDLGLPPEITSSARGQGEFKVAAKKRQEIEISQHALHTSSAQGFTLLLQETLVCSHFDNSDLQGEHGGVGEEERTIKWPLGWGSCFTRWDDSSGSFSLEKGRLLRAYEPGAANPEGDEVSECDIIIKL